MCGKFTQNRSWQEVHAFSQPLVVRPSPDDIIVTPMRIANVMRLNAQGQRELAPMRWGFAGKDDVNPSRPKHMHARAETIDTLRTFADAFAHRRGIVTPNDHQPIAIAVIGEPWTNGAETLETFVMVTTPANALIGKITDRMPAILPRETWPVWLGETDGDAKAVLQAFQDHGMWTMAPQATGNPVKAVTQGELF